MKVLPRRRRAVLVNSALGVALLGGAALAYTTVDSGTSSAASGSRVRTATVAKGTVLATVSGSGTLSSPSDTGQDFVTGGRLTSVKVAVGDTVTKGQVLATVDTTAAQQDVDAAESALSTAKANLTKAKAGETVTTTSGGSGGSTAGTSGGRGGSAAQQTPTTTTTTKVDAAQVAQAQQQVDAAETALTNAETALAGTTLKATADGTVASVAGKVGDTVSGTGGSSSGGGSGTGSKTSSGTGTGSSASSSTTPTGFVVLTNPTGMQVTANFSELDSLKLKKGESATVTLNAQSDTKLNATVLSVSSLPSSSGGNGGSAAVQYGAVLQISSDTSRLRTGLSATISVVVGEADNALSVPTAALAGTGSSRTATLVHEDGSTERVSVTVGIEGDTTVQVVEGLAEGDKVELTSTTAGTGNGFPNGAFPGAGGAGGGLGGAGGFGGGGARTTGGTRTGGGTR
ncbi:efflux RND transporter periplasmic adaptor subunit [Kitasatospora sp. DSM 101779]|uniref:efflux RND transporter periplasmic adaptor subunit n=1 Tax=Kitasatospora sp. DSM 101779 TaxID=2853165 RepID=UPI0021DB12FC|nr:biotin/lipoyl-binding protein [Kitasatospora sp. DSM 101779]MCU7823572.1 biotin/lipoyl-binding protein [Kitasatospora sp. DSM 101779]